MSLEEQLLNAMVDLEEETSYDLIRKLLEKRGDPKKIIEILRNGVEIIGEKFIKKEYFLTELVMAGEIFQQAAKILEPVLKAEHKADKSSAIVVMGTVKGDVHDIGKNIFTTLLHKCQYSRVFRVAYSGSGIYERNNGNVKSCRIKG